MDLNYGIGMVWIIVLLDFIFSFDDHKNVLHLILTIGMFFIYSFCMWDQSLVIIIITSNYS